MTDIAGLHRIELDFVAAYVLDTPEGRVLVDTGLPDTYETLAAELGNLGGPDVGLVVLTHGHMDHVGGLHALVAATGVRVAAHTDEAALLATGETSRGMVARPECPEELRGMAEQKPRIDPLDVQIELSDGDTLPGFPSLRAIHVPGHSAGQIAVLWEHAGGVLVTGDAAQNFGAVETSYFAQDFDVAEASLRKLAALDFEVAAFGHGAPIASGASAAFRAACAPAGA